MFCVCVRKRDHVCNILNVKCIQLIKKSVCAPVRTLQLFPYTSRINLLSY